MKSKVFGKPKVGFLLFLLSSPIMLLLGILHAVSFGCFRGLDLMEEWAFFVVGLDDEN